MWKVLVLLLALAVAVEGNKNLTNKKGDVSNQCRTAMTSCSNQLTGLGRCRSVWNSLVVQMIRSDVNNDCIVNSKDLKEYFKLNMDSNDDGKICQLEWQTYMKSYYGFTVDTADALFLAGYKKVIKAGCAKIKDMDEVNSTLLKTTFLNGLLKNLVSYCTDTYTLYTNRDCWGLVAVCNEIAPTMGACRSLRTNSFKTLYEKLKMEQQTMDANNDGRITGSEANDELLKNMDTNRNGCVGRQEWIVRYTTLYGFSAEFSRSMYRSIQDTNQDNCINTADLGIPTRGGLPAAARPSVLMDTLVTMCEASPHMYIDNKDCAGLAETCRTHFFNLDKCAPFTKTCGLKAYSFCLTNQTQTVTACDTEADKWEIKLEVLKINNQINTGCVANDINAGTSASFNPVLLVGLLVLLMISKF